MLVLTCFVMPPTRDLLSFSKACSGGRMGILFTWLDIVRIWSVSSKVPSSVTTVAEPSCSFLVKTSNVELYVMVIGLTWNLLEESYLVESPGTHFLFLLPSAWACGMIRCYWVDLLMRVPPLTHTYFLLESDWCTPYVEPISVPLLFTRVDFSCPSNRLCEMIFSSIRHWSDSTEVKLGFVPECCESLIYRLQS